jgi:hypothetical protein
MLRRPKLDRRCFIVRDANGQALAYVYFEGELDRRSAAHLLTRDEARRIAAQHAACVKFGRKPKLSEYQRAEAIKRRANGETLAAIAKTYGVAIWMISRFTRTATEERPARRSAIRLGISERRCAKVVLHVENRTLLVSEGVLGTAFPTGSGVLRRQVGIAYKSQAQES